MVTKECGYNISVLSSSLFFFPLENMNLPKRNSGKDVRKKRSTRLVSTAYSGLPLLIGRTGKEETKVGT